MSPSGVAPAGLGALPSRQDRPVSRWGDGWSQRGPLHPPHRGGKDPLNNKTDHPRGNAGGGAEGAKEGHLDRFSLPRESEFLPDVRLLPRKASLLGFRFLLEMIIFLLIAYSSSYVSSIDKKSHRNVQNTKSIFKEII